MRQCGVYSGSCGLAPFVVKIPPTTHKHTRKPTPTPTRTHTHTYHHTTHTDTHAHKTEGENTHLPYRTPKPCQPVPRLYTPTFAARWARLLSRTVDTRASQPRHGPIFPGLHWTTDYSVAQYGCTGTHLVSSNTVYCAGCRQTGRYHHLHR